MNAKSCLRFFYPNFPEDKPGSQFLEYRVGLIIILSLSCSLCSLAYAERAGAELKIFSLILSLFFIILPIGMKYIGRWQIFGLLCCLGWLADNLLVGINLPIEVIGLNFFQSLIPSYLLLATEDYTFSGIAAILVGFISIPYQYDNVYYNLISLEDREIKPFVISILNKTKDLNRCHLFATFILTL